MADRANVTSVEVLERFRTQLMLFLERATISLSEVNEEVKRTRNWLQTEQKLNLQQERYKVSKKMELVESEFYSARLTNATERKAGLQMQLRRLKQEVRDIETRLRAVQAWSRNFDSTVEVEARKVDRLQNMIDSDMKKAVQFLNEAATALHAYSSDFDNPPPTSSSE